MRPRIPYGALALGLHCSRVMANQQLSTADLEKVGGGMYIGKMFVGKPPAGGFQIGRLWWPPAGKLWWMAFGGSAALAVGLTASQRK